MAKPRLQCTQIATQEIYNHLMTMVGAGILPQGIGPDQGYQKLNYLDPSSPAGDTQEKGNGRVVCEELWGNAFKALDALGEKAGWEEDANAAKKPLQHHIASGVGIKILNETGDKKVWIIDSALKLLEADYIFDNPLLWKAQPYWQLSLRHYFMVHLSNMGLKQINLGKLSKARQSFKMALQMGEDSTAFYVKGNSVYLLDKIIKNYSCRTKRHKKICKQIEDDRNRHLENALAIYPDEPSFQFTRGRYFLKKKSYRKKEHAKKDYLSMAITSFLISITPSTLCALTKLY